MTLPTSRRWGIPRAIGYSVLAALVFLIAQTVAVFLIFVVRQIDHPEQSIEGFMARAASNGVVLSIGALVMALVGVPFMRFLAGRRESEPWAFLGFKRTSVRSVLLWSAAVIAFIVGTDLMTAALGRPVVPPFMVEAYSSSPPLLLFVAVVFAAPLFEEVFFRGLMSGALESSGVPVITVAVVSSLCWAATHLQYDLYGVATIFFMGLLFAAARAKSGSLIPCLTMHGLANAIAFAEVVFFE